jgi:AcrR family transcriptional regulator
VVDDEVMTSPGGPTRLRDRTRGALLLAAIEVLSDNPTAPLGEVATAAGVARSTLHRYFPDRAALMEGIENYVEVQYEEAIEQARTHEGTGLAAYTRIVDELLERFDSLGWWMRAHCDDDVDDFDCEADRGILAVVQRGQQDGTMDPAFTPAWVVTVTWSLLSSADQDMRHGQLPRREVRNMCRAALLKVAANAAASAQGSQTRAP